MSDNDGIFYYIHNNSTPDGYYKQTNNERDPYVSCFNTSMINVGIGIMKYDLPTGFNKTGGYDQPEDQFDWYMHESPDVADWVKDFSSTGWVKEYLNSGGDIRELWEVEAHCFNKWIGRDVCKANYNLKDIDFIDQIRAGKGVVTTGNFCGFKHAVSVVGFESKLSNASGPISLEGKDESIHVNINDVENIIINDSYGNPLTNYRPVGVGGYNVFFEKNDFFTKIFKAGDINASIYYGILFN